MRTFYVAWPVRKYLGAAPRPQSVFPPSNAQGRAGSQNFWPIGRVQASRGRPGPAQASQTSPGQPRIPAQASQSEGRSLVDVYRLVGNSTTKTLPKRSPEQLS